MRISSFYLFPGERRRGVAARVLHSLRTTLHGYDLGLRLDTYWTWSRAVRFYLREGLWVRMWKRELEFCSYPEDPTPIIEVGDTRATLSVDLPSGERRVLEAAERDGDKLVWAEDRTRATRAPDDKVPGEAAWHAMPTLSLAIAMAGWPLVRSREAWDDGYYADAGPPEALAYKVTLWEAWACKHGWRVATPRIAGLAYPTWAELEARWERQAREREAGGLGG